jgi:hypothetical protein
MRAGSVGTMLCRSTCCPVERVFCNSLSWEAGVIGDSSVVRTQFRATTVSGCPVATLVWLTCVFLRSHWWLQDAWIYSCATPFQIAKVQLQTCHCLHPTTPSVRDVFFTLSPPLGGLARPGILTKSVRSVSAWLWLHLLPLRTRLGKDVACGSPTMASFREKW